MEVTALDESGQPVDWWFIYKIPQLNKNADSDYATGYEYAYYDSTIDAKAINDKSLRQVSKSPFLLNSNQGALNLTLDSVFRNFKTPFNSPTTGWILYNDELPESLNKHDDGTKGHTKGVLAFDTETNTAFWLLHSWPKFADPDATTDPTPKYGQTYMCVSIDIDTARKIATQMLDHQEPQVFYPNTANLPVSDPLCKLANGTETKPQPLGDSIDLTTKGGMPFKVIAKNREWNDDFWNDLVGDELKDDIDVETWIRGPIAPIADKDGIHKTFDIKFINLGPMGIHFAWPETNDHAKWAITKHDPWVCIGDINRMISQRKRGGGTIAFQNQTIWLGLSKSSLLLAPPGHTREESHAVIEKTHHIKSEAPLKQTE